MHWERARIWVTTYHSVQGWTTNGDWLQTTWDRMLADPKNRVQTDEQGNFVILIVGPHIYILGSRLGFD